jgi:hypothetical protein
VSSYRAYGLTIASDRAIPSLVAGLPHAQPDIRFSFEALPPKAPDWVPWFDSPNLIAERSSGSGLRRVSFPDGPTFTIDREASHVWVAAPCDAGATTWLPYLVGPVLGILLRLRGWTCLHASAAVIHGRAHVFVGAEGAGKSTLAATLAARGHRILTDDVVALQKRDEQWFVHAGYPRIRLWEDAVAGLGLPDGQILSPSAATSRYQLDLEHASAFASEPAPVGRVYLLEYGTGGTAPELLPADPAAALTRLAANTFARRVLDRRELAAEFELLVDLARVVPVHVLRRPAGLSALDDTGRLLAEASQPRYELFGYTIRASRPIEALAERAVSLDGAPQLDVRLNEGGARSDPCRPCGQPSYLSPFTATNGRPMLTEWRDGDEQSHVLEYWDGTSFRIDRTGSRIDMDWPPETSDPEELLLGFGLGFALRLRGELCLHAAAVAIDGRGVLLAGPPRAGKSTLAAVLHALGHRVVADDICVVSPAADGGPAVHAGPPRVRLRLDALPLVEAAAGRAVPVTASPGGRYADCNVDARGIHPIDALYWLDRDDRAAGHPEISRMSGPDALVALVSDTWGARLLTDDLRRLEFDRACALLARVQARRLRYGHGAESLRLAVHRLVNDRARHQVSA